MISINIPVIGIGQGSQPAEADGATLDYLTMPEAMATYRMPEVSPDLNRANLAPAKRILQQVEHDLYAYPAAAPALDVTDLSSANRQFIDEVLGEGEVSIMVSGQCTLRIQESVLAGVWRVQQVNEHSQLIGDSLEVGIIPRALVQSAFDEAASQIDTHWTNLPDGVMNAPPLLAELNGKIAAYRTGDTAHSINLSLLPQTEQDLAFLEQHLGKGFVTILSRGYGNCRITSTGTKNVWWVRYFNSQDTLILNTLEVSAIPDVACASAEDIDDSAGRLHEILQVYL